MRRVLFVSAFRGSPVKGNNIRLSLLLHLVVLLVVLRHTVAGGGGMVMEVGTTIGT